jgi:Mg-chelatase subunit ChlD
MFCTNCGTKIMKDGLFCTNCGSSVTLTQQLDELEVPIPNDVTGAEEVKEIENVTGTEEVIESEEVSEIEEVNEIENVTDKAVTLTETDVARNHKKWLLIGLPALFLIIIGCSYLIWDKQLSPDDTQRVEAPLSDNKTDSPANTSSKDNGAPETVGNLIVNAVDISEYPTITLEIDAGDLNEWIPTQDDFTISENSISQTVDQVLQTSNNLISVSYITNQIHKSPGAVDKRTLSIQLLDAKAESSYETPQPLNLRMGDISYNTDSYPDINLYFSLYDSNDQLVESLPSDAKLFNVKEEDRSIPVTAVAKMSDQKESLSINVVIDNSSSMTDIMGTVKQQATQFLDQISITQSDRIALMSFAGASEINQNAFTNVIDDLTPQINALAADGACTALYRAIEVAVYNTAYNGESGSKYVVIFTDGGENCSNDGLENQNTVSPQTVINMANQLGVPIYAVGVDQDDQLQAITQETNGDYISIGSDLDRLGQFYQSIFSKKKAQYVVKYRSDNAKKVPRTASISLNTPQYYSTLDVAVTPRLVDDPAVAKAMEGYQINWSVAMTSGDMSYLNPYVVVDSKSPTSVYKIVYNQVTALNNSKKNGIEITFNIPTYTLLDAKKISDTHQQLQLKKHFKRTVTDNGVVTSSVFKGTAYTYNLINQNGAWLVDSTVEKSVPETCYTDETYTVVKACK